MDPGHWQRVRRIVEDALEKPEAERALFLAAACQSDEALHRDVASLLESAQAASGFIEQPPAWLAAEVATLEPGTEIERYRVVSLLGRGGMGDVYLAEDKELGRRVALKFLPADVAGDSGRLRRFEQEARAASALNHPNIVTIYEIHRGDSAPFLVTEYIDGQTLRQQIAGGVLELGTAIDEAIQIAEALAAAHRAGITHRDLKPENAMLRRDGLVKVLDFGLAKRGGSNPPAPTGATAATPGAAGLELTRPGTVMGTASYMSPEQARGLEVGAPSDLFSFGALMYEMVTGSPPFSGVNMIDVLASVLAREPRPIKELRADAPDGLQPIIDKLLCKDVAGRYGSADTVIADLKALRRQMEPAVEPKPPAKAAARAGSRSSVFRRRAWIAAAAALVVTVVAASVVMYRAVTSSWTLTDKDFILVADFANQTGDAAFDDVLKQALIVQLDQSPFLSGFPESRIGDALRQMNPATDLHVSRETGLEVGRRLGVKALLAGSISAGGRSYAIRLEALNPETGEVMLRARSDARRREHVLTAVAAAATEIRRRLGEPQASIQKFNAPIDQATTSSLEAMKAYSLARESDRRGRTEEAIGFYKRAVQLDQDFALAWSQLANAYGSNQRAAKEAAARKAFDLRSRVSERDRFRIIGDYHTFVTRELAKAIQVYVEWEKTYPRDIVAAAKLGNRYVSIGMNEAGAEQLQKVVTVDPRGPAALQNLARAFLRLNRFSEAEAVLRAAQQQKLETQQTRQASFDLAFVRGDTAAMQRAIVEARGQEQEYQRTYDEGEIALFRGRFRQAQGLFRRAAELAVIHKMPALWEGKATAGVGLGHAALGQCQEAKTAAQRASALTVIGSAIWVLAQCGEIAPAQVLYDQIAKTTQDDVVNREVRLPMLQAMLLLQSHHPERVPHVMTSSPYEAADLFPPGPDAFAPSWLRGQALLELKNGAAATAEFQRILDHRGWAPKSSLWPLAHLGLARALAMSGARDDSRKRYQQFLDLWKDADPDAPALIDAKREYQALLEGLTSGRTEASR